MTWVMRLLGLLEHVVCHRDCCFHSNVLMTLLYSYSLSLHTFGMLSQSDLIVFIVYLEK